MLMLPDGIAISHRWSATPREGTDLAIGGVAVRRVSGWSNPRPVWIAGNA